MKTRGGSITSCLSNNSDSSELDVRLLPVTTPPRHARGPARNFSVSSERTNSTKRDLSLSMESCCRICHDGDHEEKLMTACKCLGSIRYVHHACLLKWISRSGDLTCEICKYNYTVTRSQRKRFNQWRFPGIGMQGWLHVVLFFAFFAMLITSVTWVVWSQTSDSSAAVFERTSDEIKYAYMLNGIFILTAVIGITLDSCRQANKYFQRLLALNQEIYVQEYTEKEDNSLINVSCKETSTSQTKMALASRRGHEKGLSVGCWLGGNHLNNDSNRQGQEHALRRNTFDDSVMFEIDLNNDSSNSTLTTHVEQSFEYERDFERLEQLAETCI